MTTIQDIHSAIASEGYSPRVLELIDNYAKDIENGRTNIPRFTIPEHAGVCTAGKVLIGASVVADYARGSLEAGSHAAGSKGGSPSNWQIDEAQERAIEQWARAEIDELTSKPVCIDCIVKFTSPSGGSR